MAAVTDSSPPPLTGLGFSKVKLKRGIQKKNQKQNKEKMTKKNEKKQKHNKLTVVIENELVKHSTAGLLSNVTMNHFRSQFVERYGVRQRFAFKANNNNK